MNNNDFKSIALAVSGGADSMAMCLKARDLTNTKITALTVDHQLRPNSDQEASQVQEWLKALGIPHKILTWEGPKPKTRIQEMARKMRYQLMLDYCKAHNIEALFFAHHLQDQAETIFMRLIKGSGMEGLCGMREFHVKDGIMIVRPFLKTSKAELIALCQSENQPWIEDPSNQNETYLRVKLRKLWPQLESLGMTADTLGLLGMRAQMVSDFIAPLATKAYATHITPFPNDQIRISYDLWLEPSEIRCRLLSRILKEMGGKDYAPRFDSLSPLIQKPISMTLHGCQIMLKSQFVLVCKEKRIK